VPPGFKIKWTAEIDMDGAMLDNCDKIRCDASLRLMETTRNACRQKITALNTHVAKNEGQVTIDVIHKTDEWERCERTRVEKIKDNKWIKLKKERQRQKSGCDEVVVKGDGNCFYRCVSLYICGTEDNHSEVRRDINDFMIVNKEHFECLVDEPVDDHLRGQTATDGRYESWATEAEVLATSALYEINVKVSYDEGGSGRTWRTHTYHVSTGTADRHSAPYKESLCVAYNRNHFNLLTERAHGIRHTGYQSSPPVESTDSTAFDWFENTAINLNCGQQTEMEGNATSPGVRSCQTGSERVHPDYGNDTVHSGVNRVENGMTGLNRTVPEVVVKKQSSYDELVTNLSEYTLTDSEKSLLAKGLKFIPDRKKIDSTKLLADLGEWERRMRLREFFHDKDTQKVKPEQDMFTVKKESNFTPSKGRDAWLDLYIQLVKNDVVNSVGKSGNLNVTKEEKAALMSLLNNDHILIRPADKGSGIVVVNKAEYIDKLHSEMTGSTSYTETTGDLTTASTKAVKKLVNKMYADRAITKELRQYLIPRYPTAGKLKGNPKLHKQGAPYRVIVSGMDTATEKMAEVAEYELNEFVTKSPSYIRDTTDFINKLEAVHRPLPEGAILFCFDVVKLYPSIPREEGLAACKEALESRSDPIVPTKYALEMIETVLDHNNFNLGDRHFVQTDGVAIGSRLGCNFACSYMRKWDEELLKFHTTPHLYKRYIDDGFGIWLHGVDSLKAFLEHANSIHSNIKVELRWSMEEVDFLDTRVVLENGDLHTDLYTKPTDKQLYINSSSCHPKHTKKGLAYGLGLRIRRICGREEDYQRRRRDLKTQLRKRGYSGRHIEGQLRRVDATDRQSLLRNTRHKPANNRVPLVVTFSKLLPDIRAIILKHEQTLYHSERMRKVFPSPPLLAFRRDQNISDILVHSKTSSALRTTGGDCQCSTCAALYRGPITDTGGSHTYDAVSSVDCATRNLVYGLRCKRCCVMVYVGETERTLKERVTEHMRDVRCENDKPINRHFAGHAVTDVQVLVLRKLNRETKKYRVLCEEEWIRLLDTAVPHGCNVKHYL
jgi:hypothetical protein